MLLGTKLLWIFLFVFVCVETKGLFEFKKYTLKHFNEARRLLAAGSLRTLADLVNEVAGREIIRNIGPASNMYKLKWSSKLEHKAFLYGEKKTLVPNAEFSAFKYDGLIGFQWPGLLAEVIEKVLDNVIPIRKITDAIMAFVNLLESLLMAFLIARHYPMNVPVSENQELGASEIMFAHRYEVGCYAKLTYSHCFMEPSRNGGYLFESGVPCSNCSTHCEFFEENNGFIEEGDLCVPPAGESNTTSALVVKQEQHVSGPSNFFRSIQVLLYSLIIYL